MKFGESANAINAISFKLSRGWSGPENAEGDSKIIHTFTDKSLELLDYGSRIRQVAEFTLLDISKQDYFDLVNYLDLNQGLPVKIEEENTGENIFTEFNNLTEYYVYIVDFDKLGEVDFSTTRQRFTISLKVVFIGETSTSKQNEEDSSLIDVLITVDTLRANITDGIGLVAGDRWADVENSTLKIFNGDGWINAFRIPSDNSSYGFYNGVFYWSLFSDVTFKTTTPDTMPGDHYAGMILKGSLDLPNKSIRISDGPNIAYKNGFSFKVRNNEKFWNFINAYGINLFGAKVTLHLYNASGGNYYCQKIATGLNNKNNFGYTDYEFQCEPITLNSDPKFNNSQITSTNPRYTGIDPKNAKKPPYRTYGRWDYAKLQDVSVEESILNVQVKGPNESAFSESFKFTAYTDRTVVTNGKYKTLYVYKTGSGKELTEFTTDQIDEINDSQQFAISILYDSNTGTENKDKILKILSIVDNTTFYTLTLNGGLEAGDDNAGARPSTNDYLAVVIRKNGYQFQIDENQCGGFKVIQNVRLENGLNVYGEYYADGLKVYGLNEKQTGLEEIPSTGITANAEKNKIILSPETTSEKTKTDIYEDVTFPPGINLPPRVQTEVGRVITNDTSFGSLISGTFKAKNTGHTKQNQTIVPVLGGGVFFVPNNNPSEDNFAKIFTQAIDHTNDNLDFLTSKNIRLCLDLDIESWAEMKINLSGNLDNDRVRMRAVPAGFKMHLRLKKYDGTYIYGDSLGVTWTHEITQKQMGLYRKNGYTSDYGKGVLRINNMPETGEYGDLTELPDNWDYFISAKYANRSARVNSDTLVRHGELCFIENEGGSAYIDEADVTGSTVTYTDDSTGGIANGSILLWKQGQPIYTVIVKKVVAGFPQTLVDAVAGVDYQLKPTFGGKDMFDLSPLFGDSYVWDTIESLELFFTNEEFQNYQFPFKGDATREKNFEYSWHFSVNSSLQSFKLYAVTEKELINRPLYITCDGEALDSDGVLDTTSTYPMTMGPIFKNIIKQCYGFNVSETSLDNLALVRNIYWRKQFYDAQTAENVLKDMLLSSWSVAFFDKDDKLNIKSLNEKDYPTPSYEITDSDIISIGQVKMRNADEIYQKYRLKYDFYPPGLDTSKIEKYRSQIYVDQYSTDIDAETRLNLQRSSNLFVNDNAFEKELDYIYREEDAKKITQLIINWFVYNSWEISLDVSLSKMLNGNSIEIMDYVKFNSFFYTNDLDVYGFVTEVKPSIYEGKVTLTVYIPRPKGQLGPYNDPFNDALYLAVRDISGWTSGNGKQNDAGRISTRTIGDYTQKDAGRISTRNFND